MFNLKLFFCCMPKILFQIMCIVIYVICTAAKSYNHNMGYIDDTITVQSELII